MTLHERAAAMSVDDVAALLLNFDKASQRLTELERQLKWLRCQIFGQKSERRLSLDQSRQLSLGEQLAAEAAGASRTTHVRAHQRVSGNGAAEDGSKLRFDPSIPVLDIPLPCKAAEGLSPSQYVIVGEKVTVRLRQLPSQFVVMRYHRPVLKRKDDGSFLISEMPRDVLDNCAADVSLLACTLIDKFLYHLPLYRQHQRMEAAGVHLSRSTVMSWAQRTSDLLVPIYQAQVSSILDSRVLAMDETPIKAGRKAKGKMKTGYFWPIFGDQNEVAFVFAQSRASKVVKDALAGYQGVLLTDGYEAYERYAKATEGVIRAQCWAHTRRKFEQAQDSEPDLSAKALDMIGELYRHERELRQLRLSDEKALEYRALHAKPIVDAFFAWLAEVVYEHLLLPSSPFTKAAAYAMEREVALKVFLEHPDVPLDTNHLEREIRPIALGRKNWLFCWTEMGAQQVAVVQSLLRTCRMHGVDPYTYLVDVLQRISEHPAKDVTQLTPRLWKEHFAADPMRSVGDQIDALERQAKMQGSAG